MPADSPIPFIADRARIDTPVSSAPANPAGLPPTMLAAVRDRYGTADVIRIDRVALPAVGEHDVLVRVAAAGVDRGTWHLLAGRPYAVRAATGLRRPRTRGLGRELAGTVVAVGTEVTRFAVGDAVFGIGDGAFAEYARASERKLAHTPAGISQEAAATLPISGLTALQAVDAARVTTGAHLLVLGASGGVGSHVVQLAKARGAKVTGVSSAAKLEFVRSLGADSAVAYDRPASDPFAGSYDAIIDTGGDTSLSRLRGALTRRGTLVIVGGEGGGAVTGMGRQVRAVLLSPFVRQRLLFILNRERGDDLERLRRLVEEGAVAPRIDTVYPLGHADGAIRRMEGGLVCGKLAVAFPPARP
jgi:NADPH:quinone reductase-like Zn-dependent oxidoreductase